MHVLFNVTVREVVEDAPLLIEKEETEGTELPPVYVLVTCAISEALMVTQSSSGTDHSVPTSIMHQTTCSPADSFHTVSPLCRNAPRSTRHIAPAARAPAGSIDTRSSPVRESSPP